MTSVDQILISLEKWSRTSSYRKKANQEKEVSAQLIQALEQLASNPNATAAGRLNKIASYFPDEELKERIKKVCVDSILVGIDPGQNLEDRRRLIEKVLNSYPEFRDFSNLTKFFNSLDFRIVKENLLWLLEKKFSEDSFVRILQFLAGRNRYFLGRLYEYQDDIELIKCIEKIESLNSSQLAVLDMIASCINQIWPKERYILLEGIEQNVVQMECRFAIYEAGNFLSEHFKKSALQGVGNFYLNCSRFKSRQNLRQFLHHLSDYLIKFCSHKTEKQKIEIIDRSTYWQTQFSGDLRLLEIMTLCKYTASDIDRVVESYPILLEARLTEVSVALIDAYNKAPEFIQKYLGVWAPFITQSAFCSFITPFHCAYEIQKSLNQLEEKYHEQHFTIFERCARSMLRIEHIQCFNTVLAHVLPHASPLSDSESLEYWFANTLIKLINSIDFECKNGIKKIQKLAQLLTKHPSIFGFSHSHPLYEDLKEIRDGVGLFAINQNAYNMRQSALRFTFSALEVDRKTGITKIRQYNPDYVMQCGKEFALSALNIPGYLSFELWCEMVESLRKNSASFQGEQLNKWNELQTVCFNDTPFFNELAKRDSSKPLTSAQIHFFSALAYLASLSAELNEGEILSPRDEALFAFGEYVQNCESGKKEGLAHYFALVVPTVHQLLPQMSEEDDQKQAALFFVSTQTQKFLQSILSNEYKLVIALNDFYEHEIPEQIPHYYKYLRNVIGPKVGLYAPFEFDRHAQVISETFLERSIEEILKVYFTIVEFKRYFDFLVEQFNTMPIKERTTLYNQLIGAYADMADSRYWKIDNALEITDRGAFEMACQVGFFKIGST